MTIEVHNEMQMRRYFVSLCSCGCLFWLISSLVVLVLPLYLGILTHGFWIKDITVYEQPEVDFQSKLIFQASGTSTHADGSTSSLSLAFTSSPHANSLLGDSFRPATVRAMPTDSNLDGLVDEWSISAAFPLQSNEVVNSVRLTAFFQVETNDVARIRTDGFLTMDVSGTSGGTGATAYGSVAFDQAARIPSTGGYLLPELGAAILDLDTISSVRELEPVALLRRSSQRNYTISFQTVGPAAWQAETGYKPVLPAAASSSGAQGLPSTPRSFTATMQARVKTVPLWVRPPLSQVLKGGLVQYLALWFLIYMAARFINSFLYGERILFATRRDDLPGGRKAHMS